MRDTFENLGICVVIGKIRPTKENVRFSNPGPEKGAINVRHVFQNLKTPPLKRMSARTLILNDPLSQGYKGAFG